MSLGPAKPSKPGDAEGGGGGGGGVGGGCCLVGQAKRPVKCQRCGSGRVRLFATTVASARFSPRHLQPLLPAAGQGEASSARANSATLGRRSDGYRRSDTGGGGGSGSAGRLSSQPFVRGSQQVSRSVALTPVSSSSDHNKISGWSDNGRPGTKPRSLGGGGGGDGGRGRSGNGSGIAGGGKGRIVVDLRGRPDAANTRRTKAASPRPPYYGDK